MWKHTNGSPPVFLGERGSFLHASATTGIRVKCSGSRSIEPGLLRNVACAITRIMRRRPQSGAQRRNLEKDPPPSLAIRQEGDKTEVSIQTWTLPAPEREYFADVCIVSTGPGAPALHLGQVGPAGRLVSAVSIVMGSGDLTRMIDAFRPVVDAINAQPEISGQEIAPGIDPTDELSAIPADRYFKFLASITRGGCDSEFAMIDFYSRDLLIEQQLRSEKGLDVRPCLRVRMRPLLLAELFRKLESGGLPK